MIYSTRFSQAAPLSALCSQAVVRLKERYTFQERKRQSSLNLSVDILQQDDKIMPQTDITF